MAEEVKRKRGRPKKIPTVIDDVKPKKKPKIPKEIQDMINKVHGTVEDPMKEAVESLKPQKIVEEPKPVLEIKETDTDEAILGKVRDQSGWDVKKDDPIPYFDANLSYELTGYKPINKYRGLDFNPSWFTEARDTFVRTGQATLQELYQICEEQGIKLRSVEDLNDREHGVRFDDFLCMDAFRMGIKSKDDLRRYSLEELEKMCPKDKRLFARLKKLKTVYG